MAAPRESLSCAPHKAAARAYVILFPACDLIRSYVTARVSWDRCVCGFCVGDADFADGKWGLQLLLVALSLRK